jgi:hypothetical protein
MLRKEFEYKIKEADETIGFRQYLLQESETKYKLRINLDEKSYTKENVEKIVLLIKTLNEKYSSNKNLILIAFKHSVLGNITDEKDPAVNQVFQLKYEFMKALLNKDGINEKIIEEKLITLSDENKDWCNRYRNYNTNILEEQLQQYNRFVGKAQFTLYLNVTDLPQDEDLRIRLTNFIKQLEEGLKQLNLSYGALNETDSSISRFLSFRQEHLGDGVYISSRDKEKLSILKKSQENSSLLKFCKSALTSPERVSFFQKSNVDMKMAPQLIKSREPSPLIVQVEKLRTEVRTLEMEIKRRKEDKDITPIAQQVIEDVQKLKDDLQSIKLLSSKMQEIGKKVSPRTLEKTAQLAERLKEIDIFFTPKSKIMKP